MWSILVLLHHMEAYFVIKAADMYAVAKPSREYGGCGSDILVGIS